jgi:hypothetical protein
MQGTITRLFLFAALFAVLRSSLVMGVGGFVGGIYFTKTQPELADKVMASLHSAIDSILPMMAQASGI